MKITREKPCQRRHHRVNTPLEIRIDNNSYSVHDWSLSGFKIDTWLRGDLNDGDIFECYFKIPFQGFYVSFIASCNIVRIDNEKQTMAAQFEKLDDRQTELLSHFIEELVRGAMTPIGDTILRIDSPVTPVSTEPDPSPADEVPIERWPKKMIIMCGLYFSVGLFLLAYLIFTIYANFLSLEIDSAVVTAPIEQILSSTDGKIQKVSININSYVKSGSSLFVIEDAKIEENIAMANINIDRNKALLDSKREEIEIEREKINSYRTFIINDIKESEIDVSSLKQQERIMASDLSRYKNLYNKGMTSKKDLDLITSHYLEAKQSLDIAQISLKDQKDTLHTLNNGRFFTGDGMEGRVQELANEANHLKQEITLSTQELVALYQHKSRLTLTAPTDGRLVEIIKSTNSSTKRGEIIALFERDEQRVIDAYLTQDEVISIKLNHPAHIYFPSLDVATAAIVTNIDRTDGFIDEELSAYHWRASEDRTAKVTLQFIGINNDDLRQHFTPGLPVVVIFPNLATGTFGDFIRSFKTHTKKNTTSDDIKGINNGSFI